MSIRELLGRLRSCQRGQTTTEYMTMVAVIICGLVFIYYLLVPYLKSGFTQLAGRIIDMNP